ncbi:MAG: phage holin family protein [Bacteroidetes bacterium]|nr:phage holin family protein [Bacteroidota bacterium]
MEENTESFFAASKKDLEGYVQDRIWLLKLQAGEKISRIIAVLVSILLIGLLSFFVLLFLSLMAGYYFSGLTGSLFTGFGIITGLYILLLVAIILGRKRIEAKVIDLVIRIFFDKTPEKDA